MSNSSSLTTDPTIPYPSITRARGSQTDISRILTKPAWCSRTPVLPAGLISIEPWYITPTLLIAAMGRCGSRTDITELYISNISRGAAGQDQWCATTIFFPSLSEGYTDIRCVGIRGRSINCACHYGFLPVQSPTSLSDRCTPPRRRISNVICIPSLLSSRSIGAQAGRCRPTARLLERLRPTALDGALTRDHVCPWL